MFFADTTVSWLSWLALAPATFGLGTTDQAVPFQCSASDLNVCVALS